ncbi:MAG: tetraacyldisaccharide 4'-kinase [Micropepsaceae bacterium]
MRLQAPDFWYANPDDTVAFVLRPLGWIYALVGRLRHLFTTPFKTTVPVICVGNLTAGGTGKTPLAIAIGERLKARGLRVAFLSRGYGADVPGAMVVDGSQDLASDVGDEPLMLAQYAMTVVSPDRPAGARLAVSRGAQVIVMDDGFQNPSLSKDLCFVVVDAAKGFGNGCVIPAGPLRERVEDGLGRANGLILMGTGDAKLPDSKPVLRAELVPVAGEAQRLKDQAVVAFAGIGLPQKFFDTAASCGASVKASKSYPDHFAYSDDDLAELRELAKANNAKLLTTEKDWLRLPTNARREVEFLKVAAEFDQASTTQLDNFINTCLKTFNPPDSGAH